MALRSGYKGFKKLLPGLKLFRPGTLGIDNDVLIPELNKIFFPRSEQVVLGAKNRLYIPQSVVTKTENGVTFTVTRDSSGYVTEIDVDTNGVGASAGTQLNLSGGTNATVKNTFNGLKLVGCPKGGTNGTYKLLFWDDTQTKGYDDYGEGVLITSPNNNDCHIAVVVKQGAICNHLKFYPMVIEATDTDSIYAPYAMTNRELTEKINRAESLYIRRLTSSDNLNDIKQAGIYDIFSSPTNSPENVSSALLEVLDRQDDVIYQRILRSDVMYLRAFSTTWTSWTKFTGTTVS